MLDLLIIGAGPVGLFAAFNAGMRNFKAAIIDAQSYIGGQLTTIYAEKPIYDIPGIMEVTAKDYAQMLYNQYLQFAEKIPLYLNNKFFEIEKQDDFFVVKTANHQFKTKTILLTTGNGGFNPRKLNLPGSDNFQNIIYLIQNIEQYTDKNIVVLGGGDSAFDWANMLVKVAKSVTIVHRRNEFRAHDESIISFKQKGKIMTPFNVEQLIEKDQNTIKEIKIRNIIDDTVRTLPIDYLLVSYGFLPSIVKYSNFNLESDDKGIFVKQDFETSLSGVYAAGNCITYPGKLKTIAAGLGEAVTAINSINNLLFPSKNNLPIFSSILMKKKK